MVFSEIFDCAPSASIPNLAGRTIDNGTLRLVKIIGRGAWGVVYYAECVSDSTVRYAVKCVNLATMDFEQRARIAEEVNLQDICSATSDRVLQIHNVIEDHEAQLLFIVTEFCEGGDLLAYGGNIDSDERIKSIFVQILDAVEACHKAGVYHRDLKPENIMIKDTECKNIVLGDFGFATTEKTHQNYGMGSEPFMSPELRGIFKDVNRIHSSSADIWALGVILMILITGEQPWVKASVNDAFFAEYFYRDANMLYKDFPISCATNEILKSIFTIDPSQRTSIADLRARTLKVKSFFSSRKAEDYRPGMEHSVSSGGSEPVVPAIQGAYMQKAVLRVVNVAPITEADITDYDSDSDSESDAESDGPITPETHAVDEVAVDDQLEALDDLTELDLGTAVATMHLTSKDKKAATQEQGTAESENVDSSQLASKTPAKRILWSAARIMGVQTRYTKTH